MIIKINPDMLMYSRKMQDFCKLPYPNHPRGCPNYGKKEGCPPNQVLINKVLDLKKDVYVVYTEFNLGKHAREMKKRHPQWTDKKAYCCLYWQKRARALHKKEEERAKKEYGLEKVIRLPEAYGVNMNKLMTDIGIRLDWPPKKIARIVSLGGY
jgi:predicted metal-binding protein